MSEGRSPRNVVGCVAAGLAGLGVLLFLSTFFSAALNFGNFDNFEARGRSMALRAVSGMTLMIIAGVIGGVSQTRRVERTISGIHGHALRRPPPGNPPQPAARQVIKVRCKYCGSLNDETAEHCEHCGGSL